MSNLGILRAAPGRHETMFLWTMSAQSPPFKHAEDSAIARCAESADSWHAHKTRMLRACMLTCSLCIGWFAQPALVPLGMPDVQLARSLSTLTDHTAFTVYNNSRVCGSFTTTSSAQHTPLVYDLPPCPKPRATGTGSNAAGIAGKRC